VEDRQGLVEDEPVPHPHVKLAGGTDHTARFQFR
jgi:hypothetical protein